MRAQGSDPVYEARGLECVLGAEGESLRDQYPYGVRAWGCQWVNSVCECCGETEKEQDCSLALSLLDCFVDSFNGLFCHYSAIDYI